MNWILGLFPEYRLLRRANRSLRARLRSVDQVNADLRGQHEADSQQIAELIDRIDQARVSEIEATRLVANEFSFSKSGRTIFGRGETLLPYRPEERQPIAKTKMQASDVVRIKTDEFRKEMAERAAAESASHQTPQQFFDEELESLKP